MHAKKHRPRLRILVNAAYLEYNNGKTCRAEPRYRQIRSPEDSVLIGFAWEESVVGVLDGCPLIDTIKGPDASQDELVT
jgi:hypothetical protein